MAPIEDTVPAHDARVGQVLVCAPVSELTRGATVGRFVVLEPIGAGGMGVVYKAYDPELDRSVALKLLHARGDARARTRLAREARALAQLAHPNVVAVHDVVALGDELVVAMELVDGVTLGEWARAPGRTRAQILAACSAAGAGLAAAHAAGLVHRDFKPGNVLVGGDGRVRVADFGLAAPLPQDEPPTAGDQLPASVTAAGTPRYMAPEQRAGGLSDARGDQYSFCVTLHELVTGRAPLGDGDVAPGLPRRLRALVARGLRDRPEDRFPTMEGLLAALGRAQRRRGPRLIAGTGVVAVAVAVAVAVIASRGRSEASPCEHLDEHLDGVWDAERRDELRAAFRAAGPFGASAAGPTIAALDRYRQGWVDARTQACRAANVRGDEPAERYAARVRCLDRRLLELRELAALLGHADAEVVGRALTAVSELSAPARCTTGDPPADAALTPRNPVERTAWDTAQHGVAAVRAELAAGRFRTGLIHARALVPTASAAKDPGLAAEALLLRGRFEAEADLFPAAEATLTAAALLADEAEADEVRFGVKLRDIALAARLQRSDVVRRIEDEAVALWRRLGGDAARELELRPILAIADLNVGQLDSALVHAERLVALATTAGDLGAAQALRAACQVRIQRAEPAAARPLCERSLAAAERALGADHPELRLYLGALAGVDQLQGQFAAADDRYRRALALAETAYGPDATAVALTSVDHSNVLRQMGRKDAAVAANQRAIAIYRRVGLDHTLVMARALNNLGQALTELSRYPEARAILDQALTTFRSLGTPLALASWTLTTLAIVANSEHRTADALAHLAEVVAALETSYGRDSARLVWPLSRWGGILLDEGRADSIPILERALALAERTPQEARLHANLELWLAAAMWRHGGDRERARRLTLAARDRMVAAGRDGPALEPFERQLASYGRPR